MNHYWSDEVRVALRPHTGYRELLARPQDLTWVHALRRPAFIILLTGSAVSMAATGRVTLLSMLSTALAWSFAVGLQIAVGAVMIASARSRRIAMPQALDLWFAGHLPWSLWLLGVAVVIRFFPSVSVEAVLLTMIGPMAWTAALASAFCRSVLETTPRQARVRATLHHVAILALILSYVAWSSGGWFRLLG